MSDLLKQSYERLYPTGGAWDIDPEEDTDKLLDGIAASEDAIKVFYNSLSNIRDPFKTILLDELEREYGFALNASFTDAERRQQIATLRNNKKDANGSLDFLQSKLHEAGFTDVYVFANDPPIDPGSILENSFVSWCGNDDSYCGNEDSYCAAISFGEYIVNGPIYNDDIQYISGCGQEDSYCGNPDAFCGHYTSQGDSGEVIYSAPSDPVTGGWALIFFLGASVTRDVNGAITSLEPVYIDGKYETTFKKLVLKYKPFQTWAGSGVIWVTDSSGGGFGNNAWGNSAWGN